jgi:hypothetical protein
MYVSPFFILIKTRLFLIIKFTIKEKQSDVILFINSGVKAIFIWIKSNTKLVHTDKPITIHSPGTAILIKNLISE